MNVLDHLQALLNELIADPEMARWGFTLVLGLAIFALFVALGLVYAGLSNPMRRRIQTLEPVSPGGPAARRDREKPARGLLKMAAPLGKRLMPRDGAARSKTFNRLRHAGIRAPGALNTFHGVKLALTLLLPTMAVLVSQVLRLPLHSTLWVAIAAGLAGYLLPGFWLRQAIKRRTTSLRRGLPDTLDLLVVCAEAGLGLVAAIQRVARDLEISQPELSAELKMFGMQTRAGMDTRSALKDLEERSGVEDIRGLVTSLVQSLRFGTSIAATLRIYAAELRDRRMQEAEERAAKVSTKMLFPLVLCVLPGFFVVTLGPPLLGAFEAMAGR